MVKRAALSPGDLWLFEDINKPPEGIKAGGTVWRHVMGHALITVRLGDGAGSNFVRDGCSLESSHPLMMRTLM